MEIDIDLRWSALTVKNVTLNDKGNYSCTVTDHVYNTNKVSKEIIVLNRNESYINLKGITNMPVNTYNNVFMWVIDIYAYPEINVTSSSFYKNKKKITTLFLKFETTISATRAILYIIFLNFRDSGYYEFRATNNIETKVLQSEVKVQDVKDGFDIWGIDDPSDIAAGENVTLNCGASIYGYSDTLKWNVWKNNTRQPIPDDKRFHIKTFDTNYTHHQISLSIDSIQLNDSGTYVCAVQGLNPDDKTIHYINQTIIVKKPSAPKIIETNLDDSELKIKAGAPVTLSCTAGGLPAPEIKWKKNDIDFVQPNKSHITFFKNNTMLYFKYLEDDDSGKYSCNAVNKIGSVSKSIHLKLQSSNWGNTFVITLALAVAFILSFTVLVLKIRKEKKLQRELKIAGLQNFEKGALESINPDLGVDEQAELLPYNKKWEFPRYKLKLGKQLGSGAFGVVMKADAYGLCKREIITTVAVKMVKRNADYMCIKALASELKIMVHLGKHLNVVNLLGACTKNIAERELLVIVEYCRFGNLHNYLLIHRDDFVNLINPETGNIGVSNRADGNSSSTFAYRSTPLTNSCNTNSSDTTPLLREDTMVLNKPEWRSNYRGDCNKENVKPLSTRDLLSWAFQVARGMEYLASRMVLHGDLAARNILLAEENIVKICDFGLAKNMYKSDNYKKKGNCPLPVKWMAVESIRDRVFSTQSDVWSYGIVLWELFSLARTPYPGMDADVHLLNKLVEGYRMDKPEYATKDIYQIMLECWDGKPVYRPSFTKLVESLGSMLEESVRQHYISLNDPYIVMNNTQMEGHEDYLAMLSPPDYGKLASSSGHENINGLQIPEGSAAEATTSGYLPMDAFSSIPSENKDSDNDNSS